MALENIKTEHAGAKNGGGAWCRRRVAKQAARKLRREDAKRAVRETLRHEA